MALEVSKQVADNLAMSREVVSSIDSHGALIVDDLINVLTKVSPDTGINATVFISVLSKLLHVSAETMRDADLALTQERSDDSGYREKRDLAISTLAQTITSVKSVLTDDAISTYSLSGRTPVAPDTLMNFSRSLITLLKDNPGIVDTSTQKAQFIKVDVPFMIQTVENCIVDLDKSLNDVKREERTSQAALELRDQKIAEWHNIYVAIASVVSGLYQLAGRSDLADRIRPTIRKSLSGGDVPEPAPEQSPENSNAKLKI